MRASVPLAQFMPYGAPELLEASRPYMTRAVILSSAIGAALFLAAVFASMQGAFTPRTPAPAVVDLSKTYELQPQLRTPEPPPLPRVEPPKPQPAATPAKVTNAVPVPVADQKADMEQTIQGQDDVVAAPPAPSGPVSGTGPATDALPKPYEYVYVDQEPVAMNKLVASYPDLAREAQVEGLVQVRVLVGADGRVKEAIVERSVPMLDQAALEAARRATFKPATVNGEPVPVWVSIPFRFNLRG